MSDQKLNNNVITATDKLAENISNLHINVKQSSASSSSSAFLSSCATQQQEEVPYQFLKRACLEIIPERALSRFRKEIICRTLQPIPFSTPKPLRHTRFVCISDTHGLTDQLVVPDGDVLIHAGDFTEHGAADEIAKFSNFLEKLPHKHKLVIAGNHDFSFDQKSYDLIWRDLKHVQKVDAKSLLKHCNYLEDEEIIIEGFRIYGTPYGASRYGRHTFHRERGTHIQEMLDHIPQGIDILITHAPPLGHGDLVCDGAIDGCVNLLDNIEHRIKPKLHVFGHIHESYGITTNDKGTIFVNAATCGYPQRNPLHLPIIIDLPNNN